MLCENEVCSKECKDRCRTIHPFGITIEEMHSGKGWVASGKVYWAMCEAVQAFKAIPIDGIERRVYGVIPKPIKKRKEFNLLLFLFPFLYFFIKPE